ACYRRQESVVPQQALALANSKVSLQMARKITARLRKQAPEANDEEFVKRAYELILCVEPTAEAQSLCLQALGEMQSVLKTSGQKEPLWRSRENLVHALLNHNDFITIR
ncbi:MAG: DUF1553 domain-containing protein, partial [Gimesia chilikensis]